MNNHSSKDYRGIGNNHDKGCSTPLIITEMQIKTMRYHLTLIRIATTKRKRKTTSVGKDVEKLEPLCAVDGNVKVFQLPWKTVWRFLRKLSMQLPDDPEIPLLGISPKN